MQLLSVNFCAIKVIITDRHLHGSSCYSNYTPPFPEKVPLDKKRLDYILLKEFSYFCLIDYYWKSNIIGDDIKIL